MQLYALNAETKVICALQAKKHVDYFCPECEEIVRLRGGMHRRDHFFHLLPSAQCKQSQKSLIHLQLQHHLFHLLPQTECFLEYRFPTIKRIADVVWKPRNLIFEIQCSPISASEIASRNSDYESQGYQVIWILHDKRFNKRKTTAAEHFLQRFPHYYTNIDVEGRGCIYDQFALFDRGIKKYWQKPLVVSLNLPFRLYGSVSPKAALPNKVLSRMKEWSLFFSGDLLSLSQQSSRKAEQHFQEAILAESSLFPKKSRTVRWKPLFQRFIIRPYLLFFQILLEKACR